MTHKFTLTRISNQSKAERKDLSISILHRERTKSTEKARRRQRKVKDNLLHNLLHSLVAKVSPKRGKKIKSTR